ncbi:MAG: hypothetical protein G01um101438_930, partial [Parcubacteria group bacterium Gr01-1014_38]
AAQKSVRPSEGAAEGGCGGNSAAPEPETKPRRLLVQSRTPQKSFLFLLEEKNGGRKIRKVKKTFLWGGERQRAAAGRVSSVQSRFALRSVIATTLSEHPRLFGDRDPRRFDVGDRSVAHREFHLPVLEAVLVEVCREADVVEAIPDEGVPVSLLVEANGV